MGDARVIYWVDDVRDPKLYLPDRRKTDTVIWIKDYKTFCHRIIEYVLPDVIWFDHDLGGEKTGKDCANFLVDYCLDSSQPLPDCYSQSMNSIGRENILSLIESYNKFYKTNIKDE